MFNNIGIGTPFSNTMASISRKAICEAACAMQLFVRSTIQVEHRKMFLFAN